MKLALALALALAAPAAMAQDFTTTNAYASGDELRNYNINGGTPALNYSWSFTTMTVAFTTPVAGISFEVSRFGQYLPLSVNGIEIPILQITPAHPSAWFAFTFPSAEPAAYMLRFSYPWISSVFGIRSIAYSKEVEIALLAAPGPIAGAGLPALAGLVIFWWARRRRAAA